MMAIFKCKRGPIKAVVSPCGRRAAAGASAPPRAAAAKVREIKLQHRPSVGPEPVLATAARVALVAVAVAKFQKKNTTERVVMLRCCDCSPGCERPRRRRPIKL